MTKPKLVIAQPSLPAETRELLQQDFELIYTDPQKPEILHRDLSQATALFPASLQVDETLLSHAPLLRIASNVGVGYNNFHPLNEKENSTPMLNLVLHSPTISCMILSISYPQ